ncbi:MAG: type II toxin-antitoxin system HicA family toxin [Solidesulfovibrio sp.]
MMIHALGVDHRSFLTYVAAVKAKQLIKKLRAAGVVFTKPRSGSHYMAHLNGKQAPVMYHSEDLNPDYCKMVCKQLGLDPKEVL